MLVPVPLRREVWRFPYLLCFSHLKSKEYCVALYIGWDNPAQTQYDNVLWHPRSLGHWSITLSVVGSFTPDLPENVSIFPVGHLYRCWFSRHYN